MKVAVDTDRCGLHGECVFAAPDVFELGEDDMLRWEEQPDESRRDAVVRASRACPVQAITIQG